MQKLMFVYASVQGCFTCRSFMQQADDPDRPHERLTRAVGRLRTMTQTSRTRCCATHALMPA
eukprot:48379-Prymnesium_polylepis.2